MNGQNIQLLHVTVTCIKQMTVTTDKTDEPSLFSGPMFLHDTSDYETYNYFFHHLRLKLCTNLARVVIGTDDEQAMVKAITTEFRTSNHVLCTRNLKENTRQHLNDDGITLSERQVMIMKIFGTDVLVNGSNDATYDEQCHGLVEYCANFSSKFVQYFNKRLRQILRNKLNLL